MTAPSNANTSGLEVVARVYNTIGGEPKAIMEQHDRFMSGEPLVTAASAQARIDAAEARADRLAKGLTDAEESARRYARCYEPSSDGRNTFLMLADHIHALQQEG